MITVLSHWKKDKCKGKKVAYTLAHYFPSMNYPLHIGIRGYSIDKVVEYFKRLSKDACKWECRTYTSRSIGKHTAAHTRDVRNVLCVSNAIAKYFNLCSIKCFNFGREYFMIILIQFGLFQLSGIKKKKKIQGNSRHKMAFGE